MTAYNAGIIPPTARGNVNNMEKQMSRSMTITNHSEIISHRDVFSVADVPQRVHSLVSRQAVEHWIRLGCNDEKLRTAVIGRTRVTSQEELDRFLHAINATPPDCGHGATAQTTLSPRAIQKGRERFRLPAPEAGN